MANKSSKRLVIDTSVARGAGGEDAVHPQSKDCRDFLLAVLSICHKIVVNPEMKKEWYGHESKFFRKWRVHLLQLKIGFSAKKDRWVTVKSTKIKGQFINCPCLNFLLIIHRMNHEELSQ